MHDNNDGHSFAGVERDASKTKQFFQVFSILFWSSLSGRHGHVGVLCGRLYANTSR